MSKDATDARLIGNRSYFTSANLSQPIEIYQADKIEELKQIKPLRQFSAVFESAELGKITYTQIIVGKNHNGSYPIPPLKKRYQFAA